MRLSVIIVNYNVKYFLEQCLISVSKAINGFETEIFVVDNASADGSCQMVKQKFPKVILIENVENHGFSYANNQAIKLATGEFILLLNPDTIVEEETFQKCIKFMETHPDAGGLTVKMLDGKGKFLPESKRALPTPLVSLYKIIGLAKLFPRSKRFARYYLGHLDQNKIQEIEILPGAFMFISKSVVDDIGLLDEDFFMYGEDIDLSFRIIQSGYKNYYYPETQIVHYKGESTKKGSLNYVITFYKAMAIFATKHYSKKNLQVYLILIYLAIFIRASISATKRGAKIVFLPFIDVCLITFGFFTIVRKWEIYRFNTIDFYPDDIVLIMFCFYLAVWIACSWFWGAYDKQQKLINSIKGISLGTIIILVIYALLPLDYRFSRVIILLGGLWAIFSATIVRLVANLFNSNLLPYLNKRKKLAIVGNNTEGARILDLLNERKKDIIFVGYISSSSNNTENYHIGNINQIEELVRVNKINEIIFCGNNLSSKEIISLMLKINEFGIEYKIAPEDSSSLIGSNFVLASDNLYSPNFHSICSPSSRRRKRLFDFLSAFILIILIPFWFFYRLRITFLLANGFGVLLGRKTWVGYLPTSNGISSLPKIKEGVFNLIASKGLSMDQIQTFNLIYARDYKVTIDVKILLKNLFL